MILFTLILFFSLIAFIVITIVSIVLHIVFDPSYLIILGTLGIISVISLGVMQILGSMDKYYSDMAIMLQKSIDDFLKNVYSSKIYRGSSKRDIKKQRSV